VTAELDESELAAWGETIGRSAHPPLVLAVRGDLGAGKTTLARSIARGAGVSGSIPSPTYNLLFRYSTGRGTEFVHLDLYRLEHEDEVWALGWSELPADDEIVVIEWPERAESRLPPDRWDVFLGDGVGPLVRSVRVVRSGNPSTIPLPGGAEKA